MEKGSNTSTAVGCGLMLVIAAILVWAMYFLGQRWPLATGIVACVLVALFAWWLVSLQRKAPGEWHQSIMQRLFIELIKLLPVHWKAAILTLTAPPEGLGRGVTLSVTSPEGHRDPVFPTTDELLLATRELELGCKHRDMLWKRVVVSVKKVGEDWNSTANFEY